MRKNDLIVAFRRVIVFLEIGFVNGLRLDPAAWMLSDARMPIIDIAAQLGFQSLSRFYHLFRRAHGASPAAYRRTRRALAR